MRTTTLILALLTMGCDVGGNGKFGNGKAPTIQWVESGCTADGSSWYHKAGVSGDTFSVIVNVFETRFTKDYDEEHDLSDVGGDGSGNDQWQVDLSPIGVPVAEVVPNSSTHFDCVDHTTATTYVIRAYDADNQLGDCAIHGHDPDLVLSGSGSWFQISTSPDEINIDNCLNFN